MKKDTIISQAKSDNSKTLSIGIGFSGVCVLIFAFHWSFLYNSFNGPFKIEKSFLETKAMKISQIRSTCSGKMVQQVKW